MKIARHQLSGYQGRRQTEDSQLKNRSLISLWLKVLFFVSEVLLDMGEVFITRRDKALIQSIKRGRKIDRDDTECFYFMEVELP